MRKLLTTGDVARLTGFSASAVLVWLHAGKLRSYSTPGGQHRVARDDLLAFLSKHGMRIPPELEPPRTPRVLIVHDEEVVREALVDGLAHSGIACETEVADNGIIGCMRLPTLRPRLVIFDVMMPEVDGMEMCRIVKTCAELADTKVLLLTACPEETRRGSPLADGPDAWLGKPVDRHELAAKVAALLGVPRPAAGATQPAANRHGAPDGPLLVEQTVTSPSSEP